MSLKTLYPPDPLLFSCFHFSHSWHAWAHFCTNYYDCTYMSKCGDKVAHSTWFSPNSGWTLGNVWFSPNSGWTLGNVWGTLTKLGDLLSSCGFKQEQRVKQSMVDLNKSKGNQAKYGGFKQEQRESSKVWMNNSMTRSLENLLYQPKHFDFELWLSEKIDNCFLTPSQLRRSYQGDSNVIKKSKSLSTHTRLKRQE